MQVNDNQVKKCNMKMSTKDIREKQVNNSSACYPADEDVSANVYSEECKKVVGKHLFYHSTSKNKYRAAGKQPLCYSQLNMQVDTSFFTQQTSTDAHPDVVDVSDDAENEH
ncbi:hypothetical protein DPMN_121220 [Dreissena polymorpha]|uniref:Uncharacterized protein n=1 Tax=Dreissena polymorpha TaxID=45954 RepID=A0A9D4JSW8_DREPO|nr:hypothetical protein DPMN_121220 [Dreissena polymorpha]